MNLTFVGLNDILAKLGMLPDELKDEIKKHFEYAAEMTYTQSQIDVPVLTGDLMGSGIVQSKDTGNKFTYSVTYGGYAGDSYGAIYGSEDGYAWFQELGTRFIAPQPYLGPAFDTYSMELADDLENLLG